jgi:hypothetical protein
MCIASNLNRSIRTTTYAMVNSSECCEAFIDITFLASLPFPLPRANTAVSAAALSCHAGEAASWVSRLTRLNRRRSLAVSPVELLARLEIEPLILGILKC